MWLRFGNGFLIARRSKNIVLAEDCIFLISIIWSIVRVPELWLNSDSDGKVRFVLNVTLYMTPINAGFSNDGRK